MENEELKGLLKKMCAEGWEVLMENILKLSLSGTFKYRKPCIMILMVVGVVIGFLEVLPIMYNHKMCLSIFVIRLKSGFPFSETEVSNA